MRLQKNLNALLLLIFIAHADGCALFLGSFCHVPKPLAQRDNRLYSRQAAAAALLASLVGDFLPFFLTGSSLLAIVFYHAVVTDQRHNDIYPQLRGLLGNKLQLIPLGQALSQHQFHRRFCFLLDVVLQLQLHGILRKSSDTILSHLAYIVSHHNVIPCLGPHDTAQMMSITAGDG